MYLGVKTPLYRHEYLHTVLVGIRLKYGRVEEVLLDVFTCIPVPAHDRQQQTHAGHGHYVLQHTVTSTAYGGP